MNDVNWLISNGVDVEKALQLFGNIDMYNNTLHDFLNEVFNHLEKIKKYKEISDMANYAFEIQSLKNDANYFGFTTLADLAAQHENESKKNNMFYVIDHFDEIIKETNRIIRIIQEYLGEEVTVHVNLQKNNSNSVILDAKTILVVDDSNITRKFVQKIFSNQFNVLVATDGDEAIDIIANNLNHKIVAVLLDLNMPGTNGYDVLNYFKTNNLFSEIPVSIITSDYSKETRDKVFSYGIIDILIKPFNERDVKMVLDKTIYFNDQL